MESVARPPRSNASATSRRCSEGVQSSSFRALRSWDASKASRRFAGLPPRYLFPFPLSLAGALLSAGSPCSFSRSREAAAQHSLSLLCTTRPLADGARHPRRGSRRKPARRASSRWPRLVQLSDSRHLLGRSVGLGSVAAGVFSSVREGLKELVAQPQTDAEHAQIAVSRLGKMELETTAPTQHSSIGGSWSCSTRSPSFQRS